MRLQTVDIARGISIVLVVWGHNAFFQDTVINHALWSVRMPLLFFVAGSFMKPAMGFWALASTKADALLKPFIAMALLQAPLRMAMGETDPTALALGVLAGGGYYLPWIFYLWYLPHLWLTFITGHLLLRQARFESWPLAARMLSIGLAMFVGGWTASQVSGAPFALEAMPKSLAFFMLGYTCRDAWAHWRFSVAVGACLLSVLVLSQYLLQTGLAAAGSASHIMWGMVSSLTGVALVATIAAGLAHVHVVERVLSRCGRESIFILLFHWPLQNLAQHVWLWLLHADPWLIATLSWLSSVSLSLWVAASMRMQYWSAAPWLPMKVARQIRDSKRRVPRPPLMPVRTAAAPQTPGRSAAEALSGEEVPIGP